MPFSVKSLLFVFFCCSDQRLKLLFLNSRLVTDNFGLFNEIAVCTLLRALAVIRSKIFLFCLLYVFIKNFFVVVAAAVCRAHCALDIARDHAPWKCPLLLLPLPPPTHQPSLS